MSASHDTHHEDSFIDLRSDTVTRPTDAMREAMYRAEVGDDVYGEDPTVAALEERAAAMAHKEAGLFLPSGTQSNLVALLTHCGRGDEYIVGQQAHTYKYEGGGAAVLGGIQPQPLDFNDFGGIDLDKVAAAIKPDDAHFARTKLLCLENTVHGQVLPIDYLAEARAFVNEHGLGLHLDGARVFNAVAKLDVKLDAIAVHFDTVSICLSKGLGAPVGSVLVGPKDFIREARRWRKVVGGGMRQAGILAAAGLHALEHHVERLADDHHRTARLAAALMDAGYAVEPVQTNMLFVNLEHADPQALADFHAERGIRIGAAKRLRLVTHLDIEDDDIDTVAKAFNDFLANERSRAS
ncbi:MAG: low-specificity L-threonine aldolase [Gammaproteobacteria bacterium]|nr:low-specificity L-threonine aldolase [Gammaproteobacteria bacterium]